MPHPPPFWHPEPRGPGDRHSRETAAGRPECAGTRDGTTPAGRRRVVLLGSTGSIGTQALDVIARAGERFSVTAVCAGGGNVELLAEQALRWQVGYVGVSTPAAAEELRRAAGSRLPGGPDPAAGARRPGRDRGAGNAGLRRRAQRRGRGPGTAGHPGRAGRRPDRGAGQQGVPDRRRPAGAGRGRGRPADTGRLRALGAGAVPAFGHRGRGAPAGAHRQRRPVPRPPARRAGGRHAASRRWRTPPGRWARWSPPTPRPW